MYITDNIALDRERRTLRSNGKEVALTGLEFGLLDYLASRPNRICSRQELLDQVWGNRFQYDPGTIDVHLNALRRKAGFTKTRPIETIRGVGLVFRREENITHYTINLHTFVDEWIRTHEVELNAHGLVPSLRLTPFVNELTIEPKALKSLLDAVLAALLPSAQPGYLKIHSKLTMQYFILSMDINGTVNELKIPIQ
jgi:DNA-binding winged helix-turn-helix (wHTH) protein